MLCAPGLAAGATCTPATASLALSQVSIYRGLAQDFDITARRDTMGVGLIFSAAKDVDVDVTFKTHRKNGLPAVRHVVRLQQRQRVADALDNRTNDFGVGLQWGSDQGMIRVAYDRSMFNQNIASVTWDNPVRLTDFNDGGSRSPRPTALGSERLQQRQRPGHGPHRHGAEQHLRHVQRHGARQDAGAQHAERAAWRSPRRSRTTR